MEDKKYPQGISFLFMKGEIKMAKFDVSYVMNSVMYNYENMISVSNEYSSQYFDDEITFNLKQYADIMVEQEHIDEEQKDLYDSLKEYVYNGQISASDAGSGDTVMLDGTVNMDVIGKILKDEYRNIYIDSSDWHPEYRIRAFLDGVWKIYNYKYFSSDYALEWIDENETVMGMRWFLNEDFPEFHNTTFDEVVSFIKSMDNFDEKAIQDWLKIK